jgi:RsiW-degrading membrane proteinase PrsW (M82 family)
MLGEGFNILLLSIAPALIYLLVIYFTVPYKKINLKIALMYLFVGFMSVGFLRYFWMVFPDWNHIAEFFTGVPPVDNPLKYYHYSYFVQVGLAEEFSKLFIFLLIEKFRRSNSDTKDHPLATMVYMAMVSLGFAVIENVHYGTMSIDPESVLYWRAITAVIGHMVFGLFMGYWIAYGRLGLKSNDRSLLDMKINQNKTIRIIFYTIIGLFSATVLHGLYDLHIELSKGGITGLYIILIGSILGAYWCFRNLIVCHRKKIKQLEDV